MQAVIDLMVLSQMKLLYSCHNEQVATSIHLLNQTEILKGNYIEKHRISSQL